MTRAEVVAEARNWLGVPFRPKGRDRKGVDCLGLLVVIGRHFAIPHVDEQHYTDWPNPERRMLATFDRFLVRQARPFDRFAVVQQHPEDWTGMIGVFPTHDRLPGHVGIFAMLHGTRSLIHADMGTRVVLEQPFDTDPRTRTMLVTARYAFPGLED